MNTSDTTDTSRPPENLNTTSCNFSGKHGAPSQKNARQNQRQLPYSPKIRLLIVKEHMADPLSIWSIFKPLRPEFPMLSCNK
jgi:hypothetical protein